MDQQVLKVQKWLNSEYGKVNGFDKVPENGRTGWDTIFGLREGLQHELGISSLSGGFGPKTQDALSTQVAKYKVGYKGKIAKLIQGAFWCKGYSPEAFDTNFSIYTQAAVDSLRKDAGLTSGNLNVPLMAALFDMSAFKLLEGGTSSVRSMQQYLNRNYLNYFGDDLGLVPTDGLYQRNTNTALIYALQAAEGLSANQANGYYGPTTVNLTPTVYQGNTGNIVKVIQYGLMVNGFYDGKIDGIYGTNVAAAVLNFRKFMKLEPYNGNADLSVIKGLLTSNGNVDRDSDTCDTSFQLTSTNAQKLKKFGFNLVGRYLTGTVGVGSNRRKKNLTASEIENIVNAGLSIFPIYQDNDGSEDYFTAAQGFSDAHIASVKANELGFPQGTTIYFAVDTDVQDGDIPGTVFPYMEAINYAVDSKFKVGIYGTRNVCGKTLEQGYAVNAFVSDMSTGYSGNLGYKMPNKWAIDQFTEYNFADIAIDQDASSGRDMGISKFNPSDITTITPDEAMKEIFGNFSLDYGKKYTVIDTGVFSVSVEVDQKYNSQDGNGYLDIKNGKFSKDGLFRYLTDNGFKNSKDLYEMLDNYVNNFKLSTNVSIGNLSIGSSISNGEVTISTTVNVFKVGNKELNGELSYTITIKVREQKIPNFAKIENDSETVRENAYKMYGIIVYSVGQLSDLIIQFISSESNQIENGIDNLVKLIESFLTMKVVVSILQFLLEIPK
ncbi:glycoside hydrolase domain-containing protein [Fructilactobacillus frigidiflavus]|uniref:glycoside hydrolase domain-containing protein n=1 Tax=Fructilactobacillus frigidiflavus TaxID=3242688 RepID=UPI0037575682